MCEPFEDELEELESAEDFLNFFEVEYDPSVVHVNRLHILQRFHDYLAGVKEMPESPGMKRRLYRDMLEAAYHDFVVSDARTEKVFRVFQQHAPKPVQISVADLMGSARRAADI